MKVTDTAGYDYEILCSKYRQQVNGSNDMKGLCMQADRTTYADDGYQIKAGAGRASQYRQQRLRELEVERQDSESRSHLCEESY